MTERTTRRETTAVRRKAMRAITALEQRRARLIASLREVEEDITVLDPIVSSLFGKEAA
jgi:hypothetical protein